GESLGARDGREPEDLIRFVADVKGSLGAEAVNACCHVSSTRGVSSGSSSFPAHHVMPVASPGRTRDPFWTVASVFGIQPTSTPVPFSERHTPSAGVGADFGRTRRVRPGRVAVGWHHGTRGQYRRRCDGPRP